MIRVIIESPYKGKDYKNTDTYMDYARRCMHQCLSRGEAPFASHLLYTQPRVLRDDVPEERNLGIEAGLLWGECADKTIVYADYGVTEGMQRGIDRAKKAGRPVEYRTLFTGQGEVVDGK